MAKARVQRDLAGQDLTVLEEEEVRERLTFKCLSFKMSLAKDKLEKFKALDRTKKMNQIAKRMKAMRKPEQGEWDLAFRSLLAHLGG